MDTEQMLNLLRQHNKSLLLISALIALSTVSAYEIGVEPTELYFSLKPNQEKCQEIEIMSDSGVISLETRWSAKRTRNIQEFTHTADDIGIETTIPVTTSKQAQKICLSIPDSYAYNGVLLVENKEKSAGIGIWITINEGNTLKQIKERQIEKERVQAPLTGNTINDAQQSTSTFPIILVLELIVCLVLLAVILWLYRTRSKHQSN